MNPKVSIVIPVYNGENYVEDAIESALAQTYKNCEVIVIDDGSTDYTPNILKRYKSKIRYFRKENGGVSSALNMGIRMMKGEYFSWLSHDDLYYPNKIEIEIKAVEQSGEPVAFVYSHWVSLYMSDNAIKYHSSPYEKYGELCKKSIFPVLFYQIHGCTTLIHKSIFDEVGNFDESLLTAQDYDMWFRILQNRDPLYIDAPLVQYRIHKEQGSRTIGEFKKNCQAMHIKMMERLTDEQIDTLFGGRYKFLYDMLMVSAFQRWDLCVKEIIEKMFKCVLPDQVCYKNEVYLYGAGKNGIMIANACKMRRINVKGFIDQKKEYQYTKINNIECFLLEDIDRNSEIWITVEKEQSILKALIEKGYINNKSFSKTLKTLFQIPLAQEYLKEFLEQYEMGK